MHTPRTTLLALLLLSTTLLPAHAQTDGTVEAELAAGPGQAASGCPSLQLSNLQRRVLAHADRGPEALQRYVWRTRAIHQLHLEETFTWAEQLRARRTDCSVRVTALRH